MTENTTAKKTRPSWVLWMHIAGIGYAAALWALIISIAVPGLITVAIIALTIATVAFVGGWGRYMGTKY